MLAGPAALDTAMHGQRTECGEHTAHVLPEVAADRNRGPRRIAAKPG